MTLTKRWANKANEYQKRYIKAHSTATRRLELLSEVNWARISHDVKCPICDKYPERGEDYHAPGCELAKELVDE